MKRCLTLLLSIAAVLWGGGCSNQMVDGYTGVRLSPLTDEHPVWVVGADQSHLSAMERYDAAYAEAVRSRELLGTSTVIAAQPLRDAEVAQAAREIGADAALYLYSFLNTTVERDETTTYDKGDGRSSYVHKSVTDTTRHWYEYHVTFFGPENAEAVSE